jgi:RNA polymerase sigma-70 factor (ECF subfamily)
LDVTQLSILVDRARNGDESALSHLFRHFQPRLVRMVELRLDSTLRRRLDPTDVVQESWVEIVRRFPEWAAQSQVPFHVWLRLMTAQSLAQAQRRNLGAHMRDAQREVPVLESRVSVSAVNAADAFVATATSPTLAARREELRERVLGALEELDEIDREIVSLRHFEGLSNDEAAAELAITPDAASKRFLRALVRLKPALEALAPSANPDGR